MNVRSILRVWDGFWFARGAAENLALVRIVCYTLCFLIYFNLDLRPWAAVSHVFWMPVSLFHLLSGPPQKAAFLGLLQILWKVSLLTSAIGLASRASLLTSAMLGFFVLGLPNCYGKILHLNGIVVVILLILAVSRCDEALTIDRLFWKPGPPIPAPSGNFTWPINIAQTMFLLAFFAAGFAKLHQSGLAWVHAENMRSLLISNFFNHAPPTRWATTLATSDAFCTFAACATMVIELSALPAIFLRGLRVPILVALFAMQTTISILMGIYFVPYLVGYALFVPWYKLYSKLHARFAVPSRTDGTTPAPRPERG